MEYKNMELYLKSDGTFDNAVIYTNIGTLRVTEKDEFDRVLKDFSKQESIPTDALLTSDKYVKVVRERPKAKLGEVDDEDIIYDEDLAMPDNKKKTKKEKEPKKEKKTKKSWIKRLIATVTAVVVLGTGAYHLDKHKKVFNGKVVSFVSTVSADVNNAYNNLTSNNDNATITVLDSGNGTSEYDDVMSNVSKRQENNRGVEQQVANNKVVELTKEEILQFVNDNARIANSSMFEVSQYINGKSLTGKAYYYNFESNKVYPNSVDYILVKKFSDLRNSVLDQAFKNKNVEATKEAIREFYSLYTEVVTLSKTVKITNNGRTYNVKFDDLSDMAKTTILELGTALFEINLDYNYYENNKMIKKDAILEDSVKMLEEELIPVLINKGYSK